MDYLLDRANRHLYDTDEASDGSSAEALTKVLKQLREENVVLEVFRK